jgi:hypothetical protein
MLYIFAIKKVCTESRKRTEKKNEIRGWGKMYGRRIRNIIMA